MLRIIGFALAALLPFAALAQAPLMLRLEMRPVEGDNGSVINVKTGRPYDLTDACVEKGPHVGYNAAAHQATLAGVREFLKKVFKLG